MVKTLHGTREVSDGETENGAVDFTNFLDDSEVLTGNPTVAEVSTTDLTITNVGRNTAAVTILQREVAINKAVQWQFSGGTLATTYTFLVTATTDSTPARTLKRHVKVKYV